MNNSLTSTHSFCAMQAGNLDHVTLPSFILIIVITAEFWDEGPEGREGGVGAE